MKVRMLERTSASVMPWPVSGSSAPSSSVRISLAAAADVSVMRRRRAAMMSSIASSKNRKVERIDLADGVEVDAHGVADLFRLVTEAVGKDRAFEHVERQPRRFGGDVESGAVHIAPARGQRVG